MVAPPGDDLGDLAEHGGVRFEGVRPRGEAGEHLAAAPVDVRVPPGGAAKAGLDDLVQALHHQLWVLGRRLRAEKPTAKLVTWGARSQQSRDGPIKVLPRWRNILNIILGKVLKK